MEFETINILYNGGNWGNITEIHEMGPRVLHLKKNQAEYRITAEEDYRYDMLHKYRAYCEKLTPVNINGQTVMTWTSIGEAPDSSGSIEECLRSAVDFISAVEV